MGAKFLFWGDRNVLDQVMVTQNLNIQKNLFLSDEFSYVNFISKMFLNKIKITLKKKSSDIWSKLFSLSDLCLGNSK